MNRFCGLSWFGWLNQVLQFAFVRLEATTCKDLVVGLNLIFPIVPLTGWWNGYVPQKFARIEILRRLPIGIFAAPDAKATWEFCPGCRGRLLCLLARHDWRNDGVVSYDVICKYRERLVQRCNREGCYKVRFL